ncbi:arsenate-mycothiol transferase ArsC [Pseudofulvibacter geojedonensis]|uniref:Low molecular weight phosphatase family protein n=1 Tax=Pseudofulvibacter geojedonensis TaxID=1123758 RepID=A0ABW3I4F9_9FLAO
MYSKISSFINTLDTQTVSEERKKVLLPLIDFIKSKVSKNEDISLNFICTHNSRRSHLSQIWAQVMAHHFNIKNVFSYSGGTEATAMFPMVAKTLINTGFEIEIIANGENPVYSIKYDDTKHPIVGFSKKLDHRFNPNSNFAAIMTCSSADVGCPFVPGAEKRIPVTFEDPKVFDNTPQQAEKYLERSTQIATELLYVFSKVN